MSGLWRRIATIQEGMNAYGNARRRYGRGQGGHVILMAMHAAGRQQTKEMAGPTSLTQRIYVAGQCGVRGEGAIGYGRINPREVLHDNAPGAQARVSTARAEPQPTGHGQSASLW